MTLAGRAYFLKNQVVHIRYLPTPSKHAFVYPTCSLLLSLNDLEQGNLDLAGGYIFGFGSIRNRLVGLRASGYLQNTGTSGNSIREKLVALLSQRGFDGSALGNAWIMTIPALFGIEVINPLTVYFCYKPASSSLWLVVLEVHNTFGERHVYVLDTDRQDKVILESFEYQWTFPRQFHVSPFNDRSGYYMCQLNPPSRPPSTTDDTSFPDPRPVIKLTMLTSAPAYEKKLMAIQRVTTSIPLSTPSFLKGIISAPFDFLLGLPRTLYQAYVLHYYKRLDLYQRPEPRALDLSIEGHLPTVPNAVEADPSIKISGGLQWQRKGLIESWCERQIHDYLRRECPRRGISIRFIPANPAEQVVTFHSGTKDSEPSGNHKLNDYHMHDTTDGETFILNIHYRSPKVYTIIFSMPSARHALLYGMDAEKVFSVSSPELFLRLFGLEFGFNSPPFPSEYNTSEQLSCPSRITGRIRTWFINPAINMLPIPNRHPLDDKTFQGALISTFILLLLYFLGQLEKWIYNSFKARFVKGDDPWDGWSRLEKTNFSREPLGSIRRETDG